MKVLFDTSVLVAALSGRHITHESSFPWLVKAMDDDVQGFLSTHALAELYGVLTGHTAWRVPPKSCLEVLRSNFARFQIIPLGDEDYWPALERMAGLSLPGGGVYDALHAQAALKAGCEAILTLNGKHFTRLGEDVAPLVRSP